MGTDWAAVREALDQTCGIDIDPRRSTPVGGGSINAAWRVHSGDRCWFLKLNVAGLAGMFAAEAQGLGELKAAGGLRVPEPAGHGIAGPHAFLLMEWIDLAPADRDCQARLGAGLARQHAVRARRHGWTRDNTIGSTPQPNGWRDTWSEFLVEQRLGYQLELARRNGHGPALAAAGEKVLAAVERLLDGETPRPSLLHGDLWGGNRAADGQGRPVIFDPAVFYGDREADIAMTELFGGFGDAFRTAYRAVWPATPASAARRDLYKLYHVLNHLNLFGAGYLGQARGLMDGLLRRLGG